MKKPGVKLSPMVLVIMGVAATALIALLSFSQPKPRQEGVVQHTSSPWGAGDIVNESAPVVVTPAPTEALGKALPTEKAGIDAVSRQSTEATSVTTQASADSHEAPLYVDNRESKSWREFQERFHKWKVGKSATEMEEFVRLNEPLLQYELPKKLELYEMVADYFNYSTYDYDTAFKWYNKAETHALELRGISFGLHQRYLNRQAGIHREKLHHDRACELYWESLTLDRKPLRHFVIEPRTKSWSDDFRREWHDANSGWSQAATKAEWEHKKVPQNAFGDALRAGWRDEDMKDCIPVNPEWSVDNAQMIRVLNGNAKDDDILPADAEILIQAAKILEKLELEKAIKQRNRALANAPAMRAQIKAAKPAHLRNRTSMAETLKNHPLPSPTPPPAPAKTPPVP